MRISDWSSDVCSSDLDGLGYRANFSYTDQYETGLGDIGVSIGYQRQDTSAPEDYYNGNSTFQLCNTSANNPWQLTGNAATKAAAGANIKRTFAKRPQMGRAHV